MSAAMHAPEAEQSVLGGLLLDNDAIANIGSLRPEHFFAERNRAIFAQVQALIGVGKPADVVTVFDAMGADPSLLPYLNELSRNTPSARNIGHYAEIVRDRAQRRGVLALATDLQQQAHETVGQPASDLINHAQGELERLAAAKTAGEPERASDSLLTFIEDLQMRDEGGGLRPLSTGFEDLDKRMSGGMRRGELVVVAARPKMGKSAFSFNVANHVAVDGVSLVLSMEMPKAQLHQRNVASLGKVDLAYLLDPTSIPREKPENDRIWGLITDGLETVRRLNLFIDDQGGLSLLDVRTKARMVKRRHGLDLLVVDYLQLMNGEGDNRNAQIEGITRGLKSLAKELGIVVILLSQLNRKLEERPDKRPLPSDLRDSGAIEQDADAVLFIYRDEVYNPDTVNKGTAEINVGLIRQGEPGRVRLAYCGPQTRFESLPYGWTAREQAPEPAKRRTRGFVE